VIGMNAAKMRLLLAIGLFAAWIGYLGYLALPGTTSREVLSRPQFLVATVDVIAQVDDKEGFPAAEVQVDEVVWPKEQGPELAGKATITVVNLDRCTGWTGPGAYILPLVRRGNVYEVAFVPRSPGFEGPPRQDCRIYAATALNRRQLEEIRK